MNSTLYFLLSGAALMVGNALLLWAGLWLAERRGHKVKPPPPSALAPAAQRERDEGIALALNTMGGELKQLSQRLEQLERRMSKLRQGEAATAPGEEAVRKMFEVAAKLSRQGSSAEDLVKLCGLTHGEAELVRLLHSVDPGAVAVAKPAVDKESAYGMAEKRLAEALAEASREAKPSPKAATVASKPAAVASAKPNRSMGLQNLVAASYGATAQADDSPADDEEASTPLAVTTKPVSAAGVAKPAASSGGAKDADAVRQMFDTAAQLSRQGKSTEELVKLCGLSQGEAELVRLMQGTGQG